MRFVLAIVLGVLASLSAAQPDMIEWVGKVSRLEQVTSPCTDVFIKGRVKRIVVSGDKITDFNRAGHLVQYRTPYIVRTCNWKNNLVVSETVVDNPDSPMPLKTEKAYTYDGKGRLIKKVGESRTTTYSYRNLRDGGTEVVLDGGEYVFTFDSKGRIRSMAAPTLAPISLTGRPIEAPNTRSVDTSEWTDWVDGGVVLETKEDRSPTTSFRYFNSNGMIEGYIFFTDGKLSMMGSMRYEYDLDHRGNWVEKRSYSVAMNEKEEIVAVGRPGITTRKIEYWK